MDCCGVQGSLRLRAALQTLFRLSLCNMRAPVKYACKVQNCVWWSPWQTVSDLHVSAVMGLYPPPPSPPPTGFSFWGCIVIHLSETHKKQLVYILNCFVSEMKRGTRVWSRGGIKTDHSVTNDCVCHQKTLCFFNFCRRKYRLNLQTQTSSVKSWWHLLLLLLPGWL